MTDLFQLGDFELHSGDKSDWIINCDALSDGDLEALAALAAKGLRPFHHVHGIADGGLRFAAAMEEHRTIAVPHSYLIVDDVMTTGRSMLEKKRQYNAQERTQGLVIFSRTSDPVLDWVHRIFEYRGPR